jgi:hypothetical protein
MFNLLMSSPRFEPDGSTSERRLYVQLQYGVVCLTHISISSLIDRRMCCLYRCACSTYRTVPYRTINCMYSRLPEDELAASKRVEDINKLNIKTLI